MSKCMGCGIKIQHIDPKGLGYVPESVVVERGEQVYCKRCHELRHYNKETYSDHFLTLNNEYYNKIGVLKQEKAFVILILDVMDINGGFIPRLSEYVKDYKMMIVMNKIDLLPKSVKKHYIIEYVKKLAIKHHLNILAIKPITAFKENDLTLVLDTIAKQVNKKNSPIQNVFVVGCASVGKSTFMNGIIKLIDTKIPKDSITTSERHQTTLDLIKIPFAKGANNKPRYLIDTPGYLNPDNMGTYLSYESMKLITPKSMIKVRTYQLQNNQTLFLGGLVRIDFENENGLSASCFVSNDLYVHRTKVENAENIFESQLGKLLIPPINDVEQDLLKLTKIVHFTIEDDGFYDLIISGVGFIHIKGDKTKISVKLPKAILVNFIPSFLTGEAI